MELFPRIEITVRLLSERAVVPVLRKVQTSLSPCKKHPSTAKTWNFLDMELRQEISRGLKRAGLSVAWPQPRIRRACQLFEAAYSDSLHVQNASIFMVLSPRQIAAFPRPEN